MASLKDYKLKILCWYIIGLIRSQLLYNLEYGLLLMKGATSLCITWWRHEMETFSALLAICADNSQVTGVFPTQRPISQSSEVFLALCMNKRLNKEWWGWWFEKLSRPFWRHCNGISTSSMRQYIAESHCLALHILLQKVHTIWGKQI